MSARSRLAVAGQRSQPGRTRLMVTAIALGVGVVGAIVGAQTIIDRELSEQFASTSPPAAEIAVGADAGDATALAAQVPGVVEAVTRSEHRLRLDGAEGWQQVIVLTVNEPGEAAIAEAFPEDSAAWPPPVGSVAIERASLSEVDLAAGDSLVLTGLGTEGSVTVSGLAYDPGRNPAWMNGWVVAYAQPETLVGLGLPTEPNRLLITTDSDSWDANREIAAQVVGALTAEGIEARVASVPEPGKHPAEGVITTLMYLLTTFGGIAAVAAVGLLISLVVAEIRRQLPVIGITKVGGATTRDLTGVFLLGVARVATLGTLIAIPVGMAGAFGLSTFATTLLNVDMNNRFASPHVFALQVVLGMAVPLLATLLPVFRLSRIPAKEALASAASVSSGKRPAARSLSLRGRAAQLGFRNAVRQPGRLAISVVALALGTVASITALNTGAAWDSAVDNEFVAQDFLVHAVLAEPASTAEIADAFASHAVEVQSWNSAQLDLQVQGGGSGGPVTVLIPPSEWTNPGYPLLEGRWFESGAREAVATQGVTEPLVEVGDHIALGDDSEPYVVVGRILQLTGGERGTVYLGLAPTGLMPSGTANTVRLLEPTGSITESDAVRIASSSTLPVAVAVTGSDAREALDNHLFIITGLLLMLAIAIGLVGLVALVETLATAVAERRAEYAVIKVLGASSSTVSRIVRAEALTVASLALMLATALALPLTKAVESAVGTVFTGAPLPFVWWWPSVLIAAVVSLAVAASASIIPGYDAADTPAREALAEE